MLASAFEATVRSTPERIAARASAFSSRPLSHPEGKFGADANALSLDISDLNPVGRLVEYWCAAAVAEELHFTRAANRLHIDQSALSRHIQKLEASLGAKLFIRGERRIELTETAEVFIPFAKKALHAARAGVQLAHSVSRGEPQELEVAYATFVDSRLIAQIRALVGRQFGLPVHFRSFPSTELIGRLLSGGSHAAITLLPVQDDVACTPVLREELFVVVSENHSLAPKAQVTIGEIGDTPVIWPEGVVPPALRADLMAKFRRAAYAPNIVHEAGSVAEALGLVREGLGITFVKTSECLLVGNGLKVLPLSTAFPIQTAVLHVAVRPRDTVMGFLAVLRDHFRKVSLRDVAEVDSSEQT